jgi:hypothetical protein
MSCYSAKVGSLVETAWEQMNDSHYNRQGRRLVAHSPSAGDISHIRSSFHRFLISTSCLPKDAERSDMVLSVPSAGWTMQCTAMVYSKILDAQ